MTVSGLSLAGTDAGNYQLASTSLSGNIGVITPASLTITANNVSRQIGVENPAFSVTYAGLASGDSASSLSGLLSYTTPATKDSPAGTYTITPSGLNSDNYTITWVDGVLTVNRQTDAYTSALAMVTGLAATPPPMPMLSATGFSRIGVGGGAADNSETPANSTGTPTAMNPTGPSSAPTGAAGAGAPLITQVPGLPLTLTGSGINTGGQPVIFAAEQE